MSSGFLKNIKQVIQERKVSINQKLLIFLFFLALSSILWILSALSKSYTAIISYPVQYTNFPPRKSSAGILPPRLILKVNGYGFTILKYKLSTKFNPIIIDIAAHQLFKSQPNDTTKFFLLTNTLFAEISSQLSSDITIIDIDPDTLKFHFSAIINKKIPVRSDIQTHFAKQYMQVGDILITPDSVDISGPQNILEPIRYVKTCSQVYKNLTDSVKERICLAEIKGVNFYRDDVEIFFKVEKYTESTMKIPIEILNVPQNIKLRAFPTKINISFHVALSEFSKISAKQFKAIADFKNADKNSNKLKVNIQVSPKNIANLKFTPSFVEYLIEK